MMYIESDDFRQTYVVAKNEIRKFLRGKKLYIYILLTAAIFALMTFLPYALGISLRDFSGEEIVYEYLYFVSLLVLLAATLFASSAIVSEFEERTALVLFTRPIKKTSIFLGKWLGCLILETAVIVLYYLGVAAVSLIMGGSLPSVLLTSLGMAFLYILATTGIALLFSSIMKKGSTSAILTFFFLMLILSLISTVIAFSADVDPWFMLDQASNAILPASALENLGVAVDAVKAAGAMIAWCIVTTVLAWIAFIKREF